MGTDDAFTDKMDIMEERTTRANAKKTEEQKQAEIIASRATSIKRKKVRGLVVYVSYSLLFMFHILILV